MFWGHIPHGAHHGAGNRVGRPCQHVGLRFTRAPALAQLGQSEVEDLQPAIAGDEDVLRLQVSMDDSLFVRGRQSVRDLPRVVQRFPLGNAPGTERHTQRLSLEQFGHDIGRALVCLHVIYGMDVRMVQRACGSSLSLEAKQPLRVGGAGRSKDFYGNVTAESKIVSPINLAHSARAQQLNDFIVAIPPTASSERISYRPSRMLGG